jgi:hypothetical protein
MARSGVVGVSWIVLVLVGCEVLGLIPNPRARIGATKGETYWKQERWRMS